ncbi:MAG: hypothetical protein QM763_12935 [Agriterribacter sp.]
MYKRGGRNKSRLLYYYHLRFGLDEYLSAFVLIFNKKLLISIGYGQIEYYYHACTKPLPVSGQATTTQQ